jgi:DUF971 family protein
MAPADWPSEIGINRQSRALELLWGDARISISHKVLRQSCRCSVCESTRRKLNDVLPVAPDVALIKVEVLGTIGMQLFFSDDHDRGIYPWAYLRQIAKGRVETGFTESLMKGWRDE